MVFAAIASSTPFASTRPMCWPCCVNATGCRSTIGNANLAGQHAHHRCVLDPGNAFECPPSLVQVAQKIHCGRCLRRRRAARSARVTSVRPAGLDVAGAGDAETRVAFEIMREHKAGRGEAAKHQQRGGGKEHAAHGARRPPPGRLGRAKTIRGRTQHTVAVRIVELQRHTRSVAADTPLQRQILPRAPAAQLSGWIVVPQQGSICGIPLIRHA